MVTAEGHRGHDHEQGPYACRRFSLAAPSPPVRATAVMGTAMRSQDSSSTPLIAANAPRTVSKSNSSSPSVSATRFRGDRVNGARWLLLSDTGSRHLCAKTRHIRCGKAFALLLGTPGQANVPLPVPPPVCPSCGMPMLDVPHKDSTDCIRALEAEVSQLRRLLEQLKPVVSSVEEDYV
jgi:hypothetical protein